MALAVEAAHLAELAQRVELVAIPADHQRPELLRLVLSAGLAGATAAAAVRRATRRGCGGRPVAWPAGRGCPSRRCT